MWLTFAKKTPFIELAFPMAMSLPNEGARAAQAASARTGGGRRRVAARADDLAGWLAHADALHAQTIDMGLERVAAVRDALALALDFPLITVAGTNGKGSTCAMLAAMLQAAGHVVGVYSSPHLLRYNERVCIDGEPVSDAVLCAAFARVDAARAGVPLTPFEFGTLAALCVFAEAGLDAAVLEVGLGGRLDAVNAFDADCAIVTSIALDHVEYLGPTREHIAREKAGVFRAGRPAISADLDPPAALASEAARVGARLLQSGRDYHVLCDGQTWTLQRAAGTLAGLPRPALAGDFQLHNAAACLMALDQLSARLPVDAAQRRLGLQQARLAGRFQRLRSSPAAPEVVLDVAHNPHAAQQLAALLDQHPVPGRCLAVFAMLRDKDIAGTARALEGRVDAWFIAGIDERRGASVDAMAAALESAAVRSRVHRSATPVDALRLALSEARTIDRVLVFGSFCTVGAVLRELQTGATSAA